MLKQPVDWLIDWLKYTRSYLVLKECIKLEPHNPTLYMLAAKLCYEHLNLVGACDILKDDKLLTALCEYPMMIARINNDVKWIINGASWIINDVTWIINEWCYIQAEDGIRHSEKAIEILTRQPGSVNREKSDGFLNSIPIGEMHRTLILAKCHLFLGIGYSIKTAELKMLSERQTCQKMALEAIAQWVMIRWWWWWWWR